LFGSFAIPFQILSCGSNAFNLAACRAAVDITVIFEYTIVPDSAPRHGKDRQWIPVTVKAVVRV
jgi:hypothetical protein